MDYDVSNDPYFSGENHPDAPRLIARRMLRRFDEPARWTKNAYARDADGQRVDPGSPNVACFCLRTCMMLSCDELQLSFGDFNTTWEAFDRITGGITWFNDREDTTFADVVSVIRRIADEPTH